MQLSGIHAPNSSVSTALITTCRVIPAVTRSCQTYHKSPSSQHNFVAEHCRLSSWAVVNARSINNKLPEFHHFISSYNLHVLCVSETWLDSTVPNSVIAPTGYSVFRHDCLTRGGGVAVFSRNDVSVENVAIPQCFEDIKVVCIDIKIKGSIYKIIGYYRPSGFSTADYEYIQNSIRCFQHLCSTHHTVVIMDDFNMPLVDWDLYSGPDTRMYSAFLHFINNYGLHQYVNNPTRGDKILDIVMSSSDSLIYGMQVTAPLLYMSSDANDTCMLADLTFIRSKPRAVMGRGRQESF